MRFGLRQRLLGHLLGKRAACSVCFVPTDMSVTVPSTRTLSPKVETFGEAVTVVWLGPLAIA